MSTFVVSGLCLSLIALVAGTNSHNSIRGTAGGKQPAAVSFIRNLEFKQTLRVCNAYPYGSALDVFVGHIKLTETPLAYKSCADFAPALQGSDKIDFKVDDTSVGTFTISGLPQSDAVLLMVIFRHDTMSTAVSFESHVFASLVSAQVAVLDTYKGSAKSEVRIQDSPKPDKDGKTVQVRSELLRYDNVVAVNPGIYEVLLQDKVGGETKAKESLVAVQKEGYVVMRCGVEAQVGTAYPQELIVYPRSDRRALGAAPPARRLSAAAAMAALAALALAVAQ